MQIQGLSGEGLDSLLDEREKHGPFIRFGEFMARAPLDLHRDAMRGIRAVPARKMKGWAGRHITMVGWWVTGKPVRTKNGRPMEFATFEDTTDIFDATFFPGAYARFHKKLAQQRPYILKGRVEVEYGVGHPQCRVGRLSGRCPDRRRANLIMPSVWL